MDTSYVEAPCKEMKCALCCLQRSKTNLAKKAKTINRASGECIYLDEERGCKVHGTTLQPLVCRQFSCVDFLQIMESSISMGPVTSVLVAGVHARHLINIKLQDEENKNVNTTKREKEI